MSINTHYKKFVELFSISNTLIFSNCKYSIFYFNNEGKNYLQVCRIEENMIINSILIYEDLSRYFFPVEDENGAEFEFYNQIMKEKEKVLLHRIENDNFFVI